MTRRELLLSAPAWRHDSIARMAARELPAGLEYVFLRDRLVIGSRWANPEVPAPLGSLVKPFLALAYGEANAFRFPIHECRGCWLPRGHGRIGIEEAIAQSCNSYFLALANVVSGARAEAVAGRYGLALPDDPSPETLIGLSGQWRATPARAAGAYAELAGRRNDSGVAPIFEALRACARRGTASGLGCAVAAKTGTAGCVHAKASTGDGLTVVVFPESAPEFVLLARAHGVPGAECARRIGPFIRAVLK